MKTLTIAALLSVFLIGAADARGPRPNGGGGGGSTAAATNCPQGTGTATDGCSGAQTTGSTQITNFFKGYTGTNYGANRPVWNVAGVDYPVGYDNGAMNDPSTGGLPACATYSANVVTINSAPCTLDHQDFSLHNGICVHVSNSVDSPNPILFTNDHFAFGSNCNPAGLAALLVINGAGEVELTVKYCAFIGDNVTPYYNATALLVDAASSGNLTVEYNAFWHSPQHDIQYNAKNGTATVKWNYAEDMGSPGAHADGVVMIATGTGTVTLDQEFNTWFEPSYASAPGGGGTAFCYMTAQFNFSATCTNEVYVTAGTTVVMSRLQDVACGGTTQCINITSTNNWFDDTNSFNNIVVEAGGSISGTKTCTGNKSLLTGAAITGTFGSSPSLTCS